MGFFDIQVNGYGGVDFNQDDLDETSLLRACTLLRRDGVDGILATIVTETPEKMERRIRRMVELRKSAALIHEVIVGLHIEGPFLNPAAGYRGAHPADAICPADVGLARRFLQAGEGLIRLFTLAPENDISARVTRLLSSEGVTVAAGHSDASLDQLKESIDAGLSMFTHLGNGCPLQIPLHDNILQRALHLRKHLWLCFIADGVHIPFSTLKNHLDLIGENGKFIVTTDAMAAAGLGPGTHRVSRWTALVKPDLSAWAPDGSHLLGSAMSMPDVVECLRTQLSLSERIIACATDMNPRCAIGLGE